VFFKILKRDTFKHAHPLKVIQYDTPKGDHCKCVFTFSFEYFYLTPQGII
jgi:hypothetical protein